MTTSYFLLIEKIIFAGSQYLLMILMTNKFSQALYGTYQYALTVSLIATLLLQLIDEKIIKSNLLKNDNAAIMINLITGKLVILISIILLTILYNIIVDVDAPLLYTWLILSCGANNLMLSILYYFDFKEESKIRATIASFACGIGLVFQIFMISLNYEIETIAASTTLGYCIGLLIAIKYLTNRENLYKKNIKIKTITSLVKSSLPFMLASAAYMIYIRTDIIMVQYYLDYENVAIYSLSIQLSGLMIIMIYPLQVGYFSRLTKEEPNSNEYIDQYYKCTKNASFIGILICLIGMILLKYGFDYVFPLEYIEVVQLMYIQIFTVIMMYNAILRSTHLTLIKRGEILLKVNIIMILLNIVMNSVFIPLFGLNGAAISTLVCAFASLVVSNFWFPETRWISRVQAKALVNSLNLWELKHNITNLKNEYRDN